MILFGSRCTLNTGLWNENHYKLKLETIKHHRILTCYCMHSHMLGLQEAGLTWGHLAECSNISIGTQQVLMKYCKTNMCDCYCNAYCTLFQQSEAMKSPDLNMDFRSFDKGLNSYTNKCVCKNDCFNVLCMQQRSECHYYCMLQIRLAWTLLLTKYSILHKFSYCKSIVWPTRYCVLFFREYVCLATFWLAYF